MNKEKRLGFKNLIWEITESSKVQTNPGCTQEIVSGKRTSNKGRIASKIYGQDQKK